MNRVEDGVWPLVRDVLDPWRTPWPDDDLGHADHVACPIVDTVEAETYRLAAARLQDHLDDLDRGTPFDAATLRTLANAAAIPPRPSWDRRPVLVAAERFPEHDVALSALDGVPDAGQRAADEVLGIWRLALDPVRDRTTFVYALAHWAVSGPGRSPTQEWTRSHQAPPAAAREAVRAVWQSPLGVWRVQRTGDRFVLRDLVGLDPRRQPDRAVCLEHCDHPVRDRDVILARAIPVATDWVAWGPMRLPRAPAPDALAALMQTGLVRERLRERRSTLEDVCRRSGRWWARQVLHRCLPRDDGYSVAGSHGG